MNRWGTQRAQEFRLLELLQQQFPRLADSYRENLSMFSKLQDQYGTISNLTWYGDDEKQAFFRTGLDLPAIFVLSEPLSRFQTYSRYVIPIDAERNFYSGLALIPAYSANLNRITCIDLWGGQASSYFAPYSKPLRGEQDVLWRLDPTSFDQAQFSSMNFVLKQRSVEGEIPDDIQEAVSRYFRYAFWSYPKPGFSCGAHIIHSRDNIRHILKAAKGIYFIRRIYEPTVERLAPYYQAWVQRVDLATITSDGKFRTFRSYLAKDIVERIEQETGKHDAADVLINGLVYEFKDKVQRPFDGGLKLLSVVADFLPDNVELFVALTGLVASERFDSDRETMGRIGSIRDLHAEVERRFRLYSGREFYSGSTIFDRLGRSLDLVIDSLFPSVVRDGESVFFVHPIMIGALLKLGLEYIITKKDSQALVAFIRLLEKQKTEKGIQLRFTDEVQYFTGLGVDFAQLRKILHSVFCGIRLSKLMKECF